jgi:hypothetical protein
MQTRQTPLHLQLHLQLQLQLPCRLPLIQIPSKILSRSLYTRILCANSYAMQAYVLFAKN